MDGINDYLKKRASELGLERADTLAQIQEYLDTLYPGKCRAASLNDGVLRIITSNSSIASELRFRQIKLKNYIKDMGIELKRLVITIG